MAHECLPCPASPRRVGDRRPVSWGRCGGIGMGDAVGEGGVAGAGDGGVEQVALEQHHCGGAGPEDVAITPDREEWAAPRADANRERSDRTFRTRHR